MTLSRFIRSWVSFTNRKGFFTIFGSAGRDTPVSAANRFGILGKG